MSLTDMYLILFPSHLCSSPLVVTQIWRHVIGDPPPSPPALRYARTCLAFFLREGFNSFFPRRLAPYCTLAPIERESRDICLPSSAALRYFTPRVVSCFGAAMFELTLTGFNRFKEGIRNASFLFHHGWPFAKRKERSTAPGWDPNRRFRFWVPSQMFGL